MAREVKIEGMDKKERIRELVGILNEAAKEYYQKDNEMMSNLEYDRLYDELLTLEEETGFVLSSSPTRNVGFEILSELPKKAHERAMLSLDKTKDVETLREFIGNHRAILSWKLDGLTIVLTYRNGKLEEGLTRGNGAIGEVITENVKAFANVPLQIPYQGELVLRGEAIIRYSDFEKINAKIDEGAKYKNPRNLCSGSVRQLNPNITRERNVYFNAFSLVSARDMEFGNSHQQELEFLRSLGFAIVDYQMVDGQNISEAIQQYSVEIETKDEPSDGLVVLLDDIRLGEELGHTAKFPRNAMAFKWQDELATTKLKYIEWSPSRTGLINPVAVFEPVELEGTTVSRASVHNISILEGLELGTGDEITVYKANMIIPQIADNLTRSAKLDIPKACPVCQEKTSIKEENGVKTLYCNNPDCPIKKIKGFVHMVSRDALNIDGLSEASLEKFLERGFIREPADIFTLSKHKEEFIAMEGFGKKSHENLMAAIEQARHTNLYRVIYALGITGVGLANAKQIARYFNDDIVRVQAAGKEDFLQIDGIGEVLANAIVQYFGDASKQGELSELLSHLDIIKEIREEENILEAKTFVITGSLEHFSNRKELVEKIERLGGKVVSAVSAKTDYLINNDKMSNSSKNKKAKELGIEIISEEDFLTLIQDNGR